MHLRGGGEHHQLARFVLQGLGLGEALLRKLLLQAGLYQFKGFQIQMNPLQKIVISMGYYSMGPGKSLSFFAP